MTIEYRLAVTGKNNKLLAELKVKSDSLPRKGEQIDVLFQKQDSAVETYRVYRVVHRLTERIRTDLSSVLESGVHYVFARKL